MFSPRSSIAVASPHKASLTLVLALSAGLTIANTPQFADFNQRVLAVHNAARVGLGIAPLRWDPALAAMAETRAKDIAASRLFEHVPDNALSPQGENIWGGTKGYYSLEHMVDAWAREKQFFKPGIFPANSTTGKVEDVGHFTQIAWKDTTRVGCGEAEDADNDILVCRYEPAGNYVGQSPF